MSSRKRTVGHIGLEDEDDPSPQPSKRNKTSSGVDKRSVRPADTRKASSRGRIMEEEKQAKKIQQIINENTRLKREMNKQRNKRVESDNDDDDDDEIESEEQDENVPEFPSSLRSLEIIEQTTPGRKRKVRRMQHGISIPQTPFTDGDHNLDNDESGIAGSTRIEDAGFGWKQGPQIQQNEVAQDKDADMRDLEDSRSDPEDDERDRQRRNASPTAESQSRASPQEGSVGPTDSGPRVKKARVKKGVQEGTRPKADNYPSHIKARILRATHEFEVRLICIDPYPDYDLRTQWALDVWKAACFYYDPDVFYVFDETIESLITKRGSTARGHLRDEVRPLVPRFYRFVGSKNKKVIKVNRERAEGLLENSMYHYKNPVDRTGLGEPKIIEEALFLAYFQKQRVAYGVEFSSYFNPIRLETMALIFTALEYCIEEWLTGEHQKKAFSEADNKMKYLANLQAMQDWSECGPTVVLGKRTKLFNRALRRSGAKIEEEPRKLTEEEKERVKAELEGHTGLTDSELDDDGEENESDTVGETQGRKQGEEPCGDNIGSSCNHDRHEEENEAGAEQEGGSCAPPESKSKSKTKPRPSGGGKRKGNTIGRDEVEERSGRGRAQGRQRKAIREGAEGREDSNEEGSEEDDNA